MGRAATGTILTITLADGTIQFRLRFRADGDRHDLYLHERRDCDCGCGGGWNERTARVELDNILARVKAGIWTRPSPRRKPAVQEPEPGPPLFRDYAADWLQAKREGILGDKPLSQATYNDYRSRLHVHLQPYFGDYRLDEIDRDTCLAFKAHKIREAQELRDAIAAGAVIRDHRGRRRDPTGPAMLKKLITALTSILDEAVEDGHITTNPARSRRMRVHVPKPKRTFLEIDELAALEDAAASQERDPTRSTPDDGSTQAKVAKLHQDGKRPTDIAAQLGLAKSTVSYHLDQLGIQPQPYIGRKALVTTLGRSGVRISELCDLRIGHIRLHNASGARFHITDSKTETGIRHIEITPDLTETLIIHIDHLRRTGKPTAPDAWAFPNTRGGRLSRQRAAKILTDAAKAATRRVHARGNPPLPHVTPHTLRRTYISIALLANNFDVLWVMNQVGHADSKMTLDVYAKLQQRVKRQHGAAFDDLVREAGASRTTGGISSSADSRRPPE
ncbi:MAG: tyrosine-type recombinase/integrase [Solirubrobacterales bacterium]|nr:tyrosine-type recombinase/integrase [Solirubrobacterales bacterium]